MIAFPSINRAHIEQFKLWLALRENDARRTVEEVDDPSSDCR